MTVHLPISIEDIDLKSVQEIIEVVRPQWCLDRCDYKVFSKGITNSSAVYFIDDFKEPFVIRQNGELSDKFVNRKNEIKAFERLAEADVCPPLIATFENGVVMEFFRGKMLNEKNIAEKVVARTVARAVAKMHKNVKLDESENSADIVRRIGEFIDLLPEKFSNREIQNISETLGVCSKSDLMKELQFATIILEQQSTPLVFCHNDMLPDNLLYEEDIDHINIIDFEYQSPNPAAFDIAEHFNEYSGLELNFNLVPDEEYMTWWLDEYLQIFKGEFSPKEISLWVKSVKLMMPLSHLYWGCWSLMQAELSTIDFDYVTYAHKRIQQYFKLKDSIIQKRNF